MCPVMKCDCLWLLAGEYNLPDGIVLSLPVNFTGGKLGVLSEATIGDELKEKLCFFARELMQVYQVKKIKDVGQCIFL